jgi:hypothetical protein
MGKPKHSTDSRGEQKGAQTHAEGQHGDATLSRLRDQTNDEGAQEETHSQRAANDPNRHGKDSEEAHAVHEDYLENGELARDGRHPLFEGRKEHDEADRNQNKNRLRKDVAEHGHDRERFQLEGGRENHPRLGGDGHGDTIKSPRSGGK